MGKGKGKKGNAAMVIEDGENVPEALTPMKKLNAKELKKLKTAIDAAEPAMHGLGGLLAKASTYPEHFPKATMGLAQDAHARMEEFLPEMKSVLKDGKHRNPEQFNSDFQTKAYTVSLITTTRLRL